MFTFEWRGLRRFQEFSAEWNGFLSSLLPAKNPNPKKFRPFFEMF